MHERKAFAPINALVDLNSEQFEQLKSGDLKISKKVFDAFWGILMARREVDKISVEDWEDICIESLRKLWEVYLKKTNSVGELIGLFITIANNKANDFNDKQKAIKRGSGKVVSIEDHAETQDQIENILAKRVQMPDEEVQRIEKCKIVREALEQIREKYAQIVDDFYFLGLTVKEIADKRGISADLVCTSLSRARKDLEKILKK